MSLNARLKILGVSFIGILLFAAACSGGTPQSQPSATPSSSVPPAASSQPKTWSKPPEMAIDTSKKYFAAIDTTLGSFKIELFTQETPKTVNNFVFLSKQGFYSGIIFHRIMKDFMIQTGDPKGTGSGGPGYQFSDELPPKHKYDPGIVAMANAGPNTNGSQFFICTGPNAHGLDSPQFAKYNQLGQVVEGMDIVLKIASVPVGPQPGTGELSKPANPPQIKSVTITEQ